MKNEEFIMSKSALISDIVKESNEKTPVIFILSEGTDPTAAL